MDIEFASSRRDAEAAAAVRDHHARMAGALAVRVDTLIRAAATGGTAVAAEGPADVARWALVAWCEAELVPHALAEEKAMYPAAQATPEGHLLVSGMVADHVVIAGLVREIDEAAEPVRAAAAAYALRVVFDSHLAKENDLVLPLLLRTAGVSVAGILGGMHELLGGRSGEGGEAGDGGRDAEPADDVHAVNGGDGHRCGCHETDGPGYPELDARVVPHAIRHATVFGALDSVSAGGGLVLVAPHDPLPLLAQIRDRYASAFAADYLERGPEAWRILLTRDA